MIVTTGGRATRSSGVVLEDLGLELLVVGVLDLDLALELGRDQLDRPRRESDWVMVTISPTSIMILMICGHRDAERRGELLDGGARVDLDGPGRLNRGLLLLAAASGVSRGARESWRGRFACESMTTRRLRRPPVAPLRGLSGLCRSAIVQRVSSLGDEIFPEF